MFTVSKTTIKDGEDHAKAFSPNSSKIFPLLTTSDTSPQRKVVEIQTSQRNIDRQKESMAYKHGRESKIKGKKEQENQKEKKGKEGKKSGLRNQ